MGIRLVNFFTACGAIGLLYLSLWPGYASGWLLLIALPLIALLGLCWLLIVLQEARSSKHPPAPSRQRAVSTMQLMVAPILVVLTYGLLKFYVPRRIAFMACRSQFENLVTSAPV